MIKIMEGISPLPWTTNGIFVMSQRKTQFAHDVFNLPRPTGSDRVDERNQRNAAYIVHACNHYPELVEALDAATKYANNANIVLAGSPVPASEQWKSILAKCKAGAK
jgi:hypothetical protein